MCVCVCVCVYVKIGNKFDIMKKYVCFDFFVSWQINLRGTLNAKAIRVEHSSGNI